MPEQGQGAGTAGGNPHGRMGEKILAFDIGGTKIAWGILARTDDGLHVLEGGSIPTRASEGGPAVAARILALATELCAPSRNRTSKARKGGKLGSGRKAEETRHAGSEQAAGLDASSQAGASREPHALSAIAVASAGVVDPGTGTITSATGTMPGWAGTELGRMLEDATGLPATILNDVYAHGLAEATLGAGRGHRRVLAVAVGTGIGGAFIVDGKVDTGARGVAGHLGHVGHGAAASMPCSCGRNGHIEAIASGSAIAAWYRARQGHTGTHLPEDGAEVASLASLGDRLAQSCIEESAHGLGEVLGSLANVLDPHIVVVTGSVARAGQAWWAQLRAGYRDSAMDLVAGVKLVPGQLGGEAPLLGAALNLALHKGETIEANH